MDYNQESNSLFGSTKLYKALAVGVSFLTIASAAFAGCIKDIDNPSQLTGNHNAVKIAEGDIAGGSHIDVYYKCPGMDGISGQLCFVYEGEYRCSSSGEVSSDQTYMKALHYDLCYNGKPKSQVLEEIMGKDYVPLH